MLAVPRLAARPAWSAAGLRHRPVWLDTFQHGVWVCAQRGQAGDDERPKVKSASVQEV
jgi:hypothetical protein